MTVSKTERNKATVITIDSIIILLGVVVFGLIARESDFAQTRGVLAAAIIPFFLMLIIYYRHYPEGLLLRRSRGSRVINYICIGALVVGYALIFYGFYDQKISLTRNTLPGEGGHIVRALDLAGALLLFIWPGVLLSFLSNTVLT